MKNKKSKFTIYKIVAIGIMAALVFVSSQFSIPIALVNDQTRIHLGNVFCLLSGFLLGPIGGGLAAGIGSALFDITNPLYIASAPFTFVFKFMLACVCGLIAHKLGKGAINNKMNVVAGIAGSLTYIVLYIGKSFIEDYYFKALEIEVATLNLLTKLGSSVVNGVIAVVIAIPFFIAIRAALKAAKIDKLFIG